MEIKQKEIILISFPFSNKENSKVRPALVISNNKFNNYSKDCLVVPMTTILKHVKYSFTINQSDLVLGKLIKKSRIRIDKITPIEKKMIKMKIGIVNNKVLEKVKKELKLII
ncbi:MAG: type II toxin-antitoxin system PemK/MazF family toxin [Nanoarchaeota archaeon]